MDATTNIVPMLARNATAAASSPYDEPMRPAFATSAVVRLASNDADELAESLLDWNVEYTQLHPGRFDGAVTIIPLGPVLICRGRFNQSMLQRSAPPEQCVTIARPGRGSDPLVLCGHEVADGEVFVSGAGAEAEIVNRGVHHPRTLSMRRDFLQSQATWLRHAPMPPAGSVQLHSPGTQWTSSFLDAMEWIADAVTQYPEATARADVRDSLVDALLARVDALGAADAPISNAREVRTARRVAVERAREYIDANLTESIRLSDLCKYARTQARSLEYGFHEVMGISPIGYVRATRLHRVRRLLRSTAVRTRSVSVIALDCGFWHLSQFAVDYKLVFAESPSATYRRTLAQLPRAERRRAAPIEQAISRAATITPVRMRSEIPARC